MKKALLLLTMLLLAGCVSPQGRIVPLTIDQLRDFRETQLEERLRTRLVVTVRDARVAELAADRRERVQQLLQEQGAQLARSVDMHLADHYPLEPLGLYVYVLEDISPHKIERAIAKLQKAPGVQRVQRANLFRTQSIESPLPDASRVYPIPEMQDPLGPLQALPANELAQLHSLATGRGVTIAVVDTGIDLDHEDLRGAKLVARDLVADLPEVPVETHATAVSGIIVAQSRNGVGISGIAPATNIIVLRACWQESSEGAAYCNTFTLAKALAAALEADVDIVNLSLTGPMDPLLVQLVQALQSRNIIVIAANADEPGQGQFPSALPGVISATSRPVLARDPGPVYAPGEDVITLLPGDRYGLRDGSSISSAQVAGVASLFRQRDPTLSAATLEALLHGRGVEQEGLAGLLEALHKAGDGNE